MSTHSELAACACPDQHVKSHANFTDQKPRIATADDLTRPWSGRRDGSRFRCYLCGHRFAVGDQYRWVYSNGTPGAGGNPFVCAACDGPDAEVIERWRAAMNEARTRFWWLWSDAYDKDRV